MNLLKLAFLGTVRAYQWVVSPVLHSLIGPGAGCRFEPTCSEYSRQAVMRHGFSRGAWLSARRLARCHPWGGCGCDPVPDVRGAEAAGLLQTNGVAPARKDWHAIAHASLGR